jgi:hypothetical protein
MQFNTLFLNIQSILAIGKSGAGNYHLVKPRPAVFLICAHVIARGLLGLILHRKIGGGVSLLYYTTARGKGFGKEGKTRIEMK